MAYYRDSLAMEKCALSPQNSTNQPQSVHVNFQPHNSTNTEKEEKKKKFLTAKYDEHQRQMIKSRLEVESWIWDQLMILYRSEDDSYDCEIDLEDLLDIDEDSDRRIFLVGKLQHAKVSRDIVDKFIAELLHKARKLF